MFGALDIGHVALAFLGKAITSLIESLSVSNMARRSNPKAPNSVEEDQLKELGIGVLKDE